MPLGDAGSVAPTQQTRWYGGPTIAVDAANVALIYAVATSSGDYEHAHSGDWPGAGAAYGILGAVYLFGGAVVHGLNDQPRHAGRSVLLRAGAVVAAVAATAVAVSGGRCPAANGATVPDYCYVAIGSLIGRPLAAMAIDDVFLARKPLPEAPPRQASLAPGLLVKPGLALLGVGGAF